MWPMCTGRVVFFPASDAFLRSPLGLFWKMVIESWVFFYSLQVLWFMYINISTIYMVDTYIPTIATFFNISCLPPRSTIYIHIANIHHLRMKSDFVLRKNVNESFNQYDKYKMKTPYKTEIKPNWVPSDGRGLVSTPCSIQSGVFVRLHAVGFPPRWPTWRRLPRKCGAGRRQSQQQLPKTAPPFLLQTLPKLSGLGKGRHSCTHLVSPFWECIPRHFYHSSIQTTSTT